MTQTKLICDSQRVTREDHNRFNSRGQQIESLKPFYRRLRHWKEERLRRTENRVSETQLAS